LGERFNGIEEVVGSIPSGSTKQAIDFVDYLQDSFSRLVPAKNR
jgi:hypothetical protein